MICWQDKDFPHNYFYKEMREYIVIVQTVSQLRITEIQRGEISAFWVSEDRLYRGCLSSSACSVISVVSNSLRPPDCSPPGFLSMRILQARILEQVAMPSSRGSSRTQGSNPGLLHCKRILHRLRRWRPCYLLWVCFKAASFEALQALVWNSGTW